MDLLWTLIIGGVVGWLASILMKTNAQMGVLANIVVGIVGSITGTVIANAAGLTPRSSAGGWIVSVLGAALLIGILRSLGVFGRTRAWR
jgi:uncharacterized membrane protein YeaQ/YmgE (transglycosylase-associated protein family)